MKISNSQIFLYFCISFIAGIFINSLFYFSTISILLFLICGIFLITFFWRYPKAKILTIAGFCLLIFLAGACHHQQVELKIANLGPQDVGYYNDTETLITFYGKIIKEPDVRENNTKLTVMSEESAKGRVLVSVSRYPEYNYGDELEITGELKTPHIFEDFNYKDYLAKQGIYSVMYYPQIKKINRDPFSVLLDRERVSVYFIYGEILGFKNKLRNSIYQNLSPPQSSILGAIILGDKQKISEEWKNKFNITGIRHITCVSGMHIVILGWILMWLGMKLGLWRGQAFYFVILL
jgi:competence protein ComEC